MRYIQGTGVVGSSAPTEGVSLQVGLGNYEQNACAASLVTIYNATGNLDVGQTLYIDFYLTQPLTGYSYVSDQGDVFRMDSATGLVVSFEAPCIAYPSS